MDILPVLWLNFPVNFDYEHCAKKKNSNLKNIQLFTS